MFSLLSSVFLAAPLLWWRLLSDAGIAGGRSQSEEGEPGDGRLFGGGVSAQSSLHLADFKPCGEFTHLGLDLFF